MRRFTSNLNQNSVSPTERRFNDGTPAERIEMDSVFAEVFGLPDSPRLTLSTLPMEGLRITFQFESDLDQSAFETDFSRLGLRSFKQTVDQKKANVIWQPHPIGGVSVIAALYCNDLSEFEEFLNSVITSFQNTLADKCELILVDDFSPNIVEIRKKANEFAPRFANSNIGFRLIEKQSNDGPGITRNLGARVADFSNLLFLDSDDVIHPLYVQIFAQELEMGSNFVSCDMAYPNRQIFCALPTNFNETLYANGNGSCIGLNKEHAWISQASSAGNLYTHEKLSHYEDWELNLVLKGLGLSVCILPIPLYHYRRKDSGRDSSKSNLQVYARFRCIESAWSRLSDNGVRTGHGLTMKSFLPIYQQLLHQHSFPFQGRCLGRQQSRVGIIKTVMTAAVIFVWPAGIPKWLLQAKSIVVRTLHKLGI